MSVSEDEISSSSSIESGSKQENGNLIDRVINKEENSALWAWPLNEDGFVRCSTGKDKFRVELDFKYLLNRDADIRKFDSLKSSGSSYTFTIGLCSIKRPELYFWRLEVYLFTHTEMILIEAYREVFSDYSNIPRVRSSKTLRKVRKTYRLPEQYDITTATVNVCDVLGAIIIEAMPKSRST